MRYLVDSDWVINYLNGDGFVRRRLDDLRHEGVSLSVVTLAEVYHGIFASREPETEDRQFTVFLRRFEV